MLLVHLQGGLMIKHIVTFIILTLVPAFKGESKVYKIHQRPEHLKLNPIQAHF